MSLSCALVAGIVLSLLRPVVSPVSAQGEGYVATPDGARLFYRTVGKGTDTLVAIHGGPGVDLESIAEDFAPLARQHTVIFYDQRGAGRSTLPMIRSDLCASDARGIRFGLTTTNRLVMHSYGDWDVRPQLRTLRVPTLVIHGEQEAIPMDLVEEWVSSLPLATLVRVPRAAHFAYAERPDVVWPAVEAFLKR